MGYHFSLYGVFSYLSHISNHEGVPPEVKRDLGYATDKIAEEKPIEALSDLCKSRALDMMT